MSRQGSCTESYSSLIPWLCRIVNQCSKVSTLDYAGFQYFVIVTCWKAIICWGDQEEIDATSQQCLIHIGGNNLAPVGTSFGVTETQNAQRRKHN